GGRNPFWSDRHGPCLSLHLAGARDRGRRPKNRMSLKQNVTQLGVAVLLLGELCGCATHLATVKTRPGRLPSNLTNEEALEPAKKYLAAAEHEQSLPALGHDLLAAKVSYGVLERRPRDESARDIYNFAVARTVQDIERANLQPWR